MENFCHQKMLNIFYHIEKNFFSLFFREYEGGVRVRVRRLNYVKICSFYSSTKKKVIFFIQKAETGMFFPLSIFSST
jgi:hypothetical protein